jgi:hypothetical protein
MTGADASSPSWNAPDPAWKSPGTASAAQARFRSLWPSIVAAAPAALARYDAEIRGGREISSTLLSCRDAAERVRGTVGEADPALLGSVGALADGECWQLTCSLGYEDLFAYLRASDGALLMLWLPPEG